MVPATPLPASRDLMPLLYETIFEFRKRLELYRGRDGLSLEYFPVGACGDASMLLAHHLSKSGFGPCRYTVGRTGSCTHAWLSDGNLVIDITGDQFEGFGKPVFIGPATPWHQGFDVQEEHDAVISIWGPEWETKFRVAYDALMKLSIVD